MTTKTPEQQKDTDRLNRYIAREGLVSFMSNTKWRKLVDTISSIEGYRPRFRVKVVRDEFLEESWDFSWPYHLPPYKSIEWLDLDCNLRTRRGNLIEDHVESFFEKLSLSLNMVHIEFEKIEDENILRVYGYKRSGKSV